MQDASVMLEQRKRESGSGWELAHGYGTKVHILDNLYLLTALSKLSGKRIRHPEMTATLRRVYQIMLANVAGHDLPRVRTEEPTRMQDLHPVEGVYRGDVLDPATRIVIVDIIRAGIVPSQVCFEMLTAVLPDENIRLDHLNMARKSDAAGHVVGVDLSGSKIGGTVDGSILLLPDPMGATGSTTIRAIDHYRRHHGKPARVIAMPMIATPEYLRAVLDAVEDVVIYTARLDRGLSSPEVLARLPGERWSEERGLNEHGYIVPGAGGMGEVLNNAWC